MNSGTKNLKRKENYASKNKRGERKKERKKINTRNLDFRNYDIVFIMLVFQLIIFLFQFFVEPVIDYECPKTIERKANNVPRIEFQMNIF